MKVKKHLNKWWLCYMILAWQWIKLLVKKKLKSIYFKFIWFCDFYALVTRGLKWLTVSTTLVGRIKLLWKQIDAPVVFVVNCIHKYILLNKIESTLRKIKVSIVLKWSTFNGVLMRFSWYHLAINLSHENVRGQRGLGTKYISWAIKMLHGPLKIPC